jgi:hypothetical protein
MSSMAIVTSTKVTLANTTAPVSTAAMAAATVSPAAVRLCTRRKQRPGKQGRCQYHRRSSCSHDFSFRRAKPPSHMVARL